MTLRFSQFAACAVLACATTAAFAAMPQAAAKKALTPQQQRMADCSHQATGKKGDERKAFMSSCLKGKSAAAPAAKATQQEKMKTCSAEAKSKSLKGADRKAFMSTCLKGSAAAPAAH
jgi:hypothetical protein